MNRLLFIFRLVQWIISKSHIRVLNGNRIGCQQSTKYTPFVVLWLTSVTIYVIFVEVEVKCTISYFVSKPRFLLAYNLTSLARSVSILTSSRYTGTHHTGLLFSVPIVLLGSTSVPFLSFQYSLKIQLLFLIDYYYLWLTAQICVYIYICRHICTDRLFGRRHHKPYGFRRYTMSICCLCNV